jgi:two-component system sensor histidine kinase and response regulator WspE
MSDTGLPSGDLSAFSMLDLFRMEAQQQARVLTDGLLLLERGSVDGATLEALMRAAHSVKGAAAIVGLAPMVGLAHAMEDVFVAAQESRLVLGSGDVDALLSAIDLMLALAALADEALGAAGTTHGAALAAAVDALDALRSRGPRAPAPATVPAPAARMPRAAPVAATTAAAQAPAPVAGAPAAGTPAAGAPADGTPASRACTPASSSRGSAHCSATGASSAAWRRRSNRCTTPCSRPAGPTCSTSWRWRRTVRVRSSVRCTA